MSTGRYAVIGHPIAHSLSPRIHTAFAQQSGHDLTYETVDAPAGGFAPAAKAFFDDGGLGLNVTLPFKLDAFEWVNSHDAYARQAQAVNTIRPSEAGFEGLNTDGIGLIRDIERLGWQLAQSRILILGAGGATRGILGPLIDAGATVCIANRTVAKAEALAGAFDAVDACGLDAVRADWDLVINATSAGLSGEASIVAIDAVAGARCYDLFYRLDGPTPFIDWVSPVAKASADGLGMLVEQAAEAFRLWRGCAPQTAAVLASLR